MTPGLLPDEVRAVTALERKARALGSDARCWRCGTDDPAVLCRRPLPMTPGSRAGLHTCYRHRVLHGTEVHHLLGRRRAPRLVLRIPAQLHRRLHALHGVEAARSLPWLAGQLGVPVATLLHGAGP